MQTLPRSRPGGESTSFTPRVVRHAIPPQFTWSDAPVHTLQKHSYSNNFGHLVIDDLYSAWAGMQTFNLQSYDVQASARFPALGLLNLKFLLGIQVLLLDGCRALFQPFRYCNDTAGYHSHPPSTSSSSNSCSGCCDRAPYTHELCHKVRCTSHITCLTSRQLMTRHPGVWAPWFHSGHFVESCCVPARRRVLQERHRRSQHGIRREVRSAVAVHHPPPIHAALPEQSALESPVAVRRQGCAAAAQGEVVSLVVGGRRR